MKNQTVQDVMDAWTFVVHDTSLQTQLVHEFENGLHTKLMIAMDTKDTHATIWILAAWMQVLEFVDRQTVSLTTQTLPNETMDHTRRLYVRLWGVTDAVDKYVAMVRARGNVQESILSNNNRKRKFDRL